MEESADAQETFKVLGCLGCWVSLDDLHSACRNRNAVGINEVSKKRQRCTTQLALPLVDEQALLSKSLEEDEQISHVVFLPFTANDDVIHVDEARKR